MGAKIVGLGSPVITVTGVKELHPTHHITVSDRIIAGTWAFAAAMTQGDITIHGARADHMEVMLEKLTSAGAIVGQVGSALAATHDVDGGPENRVDAGLALGHGVILAAR